MNNLIKNPYYIFWLAIPLWILIGILHKERSIGINIHDTYYVILWVYLTYFISGILLIIGFVYWLMRKANKPLSRRLNIVHTMLTLGGLFFVMVLTQFYRDSWEAYKFNENLTLLIYIIILIAVLAQLVFPVNILRGLLLKPEISTDNP